MLAERNINADTQNVNVKKYKGTHSKNIHRKKSKKKPMHYRLRSIKRGQFRFSNFASHFKQKSYFHFLIH